MKHKAYVLKTVLPQGALFPFDFGSVLGSVTDDGNPVDVPRKSVCPGAARTYFDG